MGHTLETWYGRTHYDGTPVDIRDVFLTAERRTHFMTEPAITYPIGTKCRACINDPERPGMVDVQLPNGDMIRCMATEVSIIGKEDM